MRTLSGLLTMLALSMLTGCASSPVANLEPTELPITQSWSGDFPVAELQQLPEGQQKSGVGYLGNAAAFTAVWTHFKPGEAVPTVDFGKNLMVFHRNVDFYNRTRIFKTTLKDGVVEVLAMETMSAMPVEGKVAMALAAIPRANVKYIQAGPARIPVVLE